jgi:DNA polymerase-1
MYNIYMESNKSVLFIDGNNLFHRSYHGLKRSGLIGLDGEPIWSSHGFLLSISKIISIVKPSEVIFAFDTINSCVERRKILKDYKLNRSSKNIELIYEQNKLIYILEECGFTVAMIDNREADDIIGSGSKYCSERDIKNYIYSTDRDIYQLLNEFTYIIDSKYNIINYKSFLNKYGLTPFQYYEMAAIRGEPGDNIIGVKGIGEKGAIDLIKRYGSIDNVISSYFTGDDNKYVKNVYENIDLIKNNLAVAKLYCEIPMEGYHIHSEKNYKKNIKLDILLKIGLNKAYKELENVLYEK